jgi:hypothetical protein
VLRLVVQGPQSLVLSTLCTSCPHSQAGCCAAPPRITLADLGRIVALGGRDWLLQELAEGRLARGERWLFIRRPARPLAPGGEPLAACVYLGPGGCTIPHDRRSATCNYYVCEDALSEPDALAGDARALQQALLDAFVRWDAELSQQADQAFSDGITLDATFLDWLGARFEELAASSEPGPLAPVSTDGNASVPGDR